MSKLKHPELVELILAAVDRLLHVEKAQVLDAEGVKLHPSEIHLLLFLHARPDSNATEIAHRFGITKGAVSQTLSRLEGKGVLTKERSPGTQGDLAISMTELGRRLMVEVLRLERNAAARFDAHLEGLSHQDREAVGRFFRRMVRGGPNIE